MANLNPEQLKKVAEWFAAGASLDEIQKRLRAELDVHMTYLDLRLLVADLPQPEEPEREAPISERAAPISERAAPISERAALAAQDEENAADMSVDGEADSAAKAAHSDMGDNQPPPTRYDLDAPDADEGIPKPDVRVEMDALTIPGTMASGDVTFSDGTKGKWYLDQMGRLGLGNLPEGYRPSPADVPLFQSNLMSLLQSRGMA